MDISHLKLELDLLDRGYRYVAGVDEAGRGPWAGPLVAASVILDLEKIVKSLPNPNSRNNDVIPAEAGKPQEWWRNINDSKKLTHKKRQTLFEIIKQEAVAYKIVQISPADIDRLGVGEANKRAMSEAVCWLGQVQAPDHVISDYFQVLNWDKNRQTNVPKGDGVSVSVAAASILAKVYRDALMCGFSERFPRYGFERHKGYGTRAHREALEKWGPCEIHRFSFRPVSEIN
jgi:ribonuclease HII